MRLNSLQLTNFRQHADSHIDFESGITGIIGPNGAGKSTILEAIAWALYGQPAARGNRDSIRFARAGARAGVRVELDFELAGHRYRVVRGLTSAELYLDGGADPIANTISGVAEVLQRRLGMSRVEFFHTYFTGQKELNVMASMGPTERAQFLSRVLGYERLRVAQEAIRERRREMAAELNGVRAGMPDPAAVAAALQEASSRLSAATSTQTTVQQQSNEARARLDVIAPTWSAAQAARERYHEVVGELRVLESQVESAERDRERLEKELTSLDGARSELVSTSAEIAPLAAQLDEFERLEALALSEGRRKTLTESIRALADELSVSREKRALLVEATAQEPTVAEQLAKVSKIAEETEVALERARTEWVRDRQEAETKRDALRQQYSDVKAQREQVLNVGEEGTCPTCTRVLGDSFRTVLDQLDAQLETITVDGRYFATRLEQLEATPADLQKLEDERRELQKDVGSLERQLARAQSAVVELGQLNRELETKTQRYTQWTADLAAIPGGYDAPRHEFLKREMERLGPLNERATRLATLLEREPVIRAQLTLVIESLNKLKAQGDALARQRDAIRYSEADYHTLRADQERALAAVAQADVALATVTAEVAAAQRALTVADKAQKDLKRAEARAEELLRDRKLHDELDRAYTDLRTDLNHALRPEVSELASAFLAELTDHRYSELELDDQYNIVVLEEGRPKPVISGGEEDLANLVLRLAISQMIAERAGQAFSLLILDEVFGSLDDVRRHNVVELLRRLQDRFEQVILITHIESVREGLDRVLLVEYNEATGASAVRAAADALPLWNDGGLSLASVSGDET